MKNRKKLWQGEGQEAGAQVDGNSTAAYNKSRSKRKAKEAERDGAGTLSRPKKIAGAASGGREGPAEGRTGCTLEELELFLGEVLERA